MDVIVPLIRNIMTTRFEDIPADVVEAAKKSVF